MRNSHDRATAGLLLFSSLLAFVLLAYSAYRENLAVDWRHYQSDYKQRLLDAAQNDKDRRTARRFTVGQKQIFLPGLAKVDRCVTCHAAIDNPSMENAPQPLTAHSGGIMLKHPKEQFGCTICHLGQGRATSEADAHGHVPHWEEPMRAIEEIDASCAKCHSERSLPGAPRYNKAMALFEEKACQGCHNLRGAGGNAGPALDSAGTNNDAEWHFKHFKDPKSVVATSEMPNLELTDEEAHALVFLMMCLTGDDIPPELWSEPSVSIGGLMLDDGPTTAGALREYVGSRFCISCHKGTHPAAVDGWRESKMASTFERIKDEPVKDNCMPCHTTGFNPRTGRYAEEGVTCEACHGPGREPVKAVLGGRVDEHKSALRITADSKLVCARCHNPHVVVGTHADRYRQLPPRRWEEVVAADGEEEQWPLRPAELPTVDGEEPVAAAPKEPKPPKPIELDEERGCVSSQCHLAIVANEFIHPSVAQQQCGDCHKMIAEGKHGFVLAAQPPDLCYGCHEVPEKAKVVHGPVALGMCTACHNPHSAANRAMLTETGDEHCFMCHSEMERYVGTIRVQHGAIEEGGCIACHDPHRSDFALRLHKALPDLCVECHEATGMAISAATTPHEPVTTGKKCVNCHNPHGSNVEMILAEEQMDLCLGCHDKPLETPTGTIIDMKTWIESNPERHGPIRDGNCAACHQPHGSEHFRILMKEFPRTFYSAFSLDNYELCFSCHEQTLVLDERTRVLTGFRNGDVNLHYLHVNREKGRTCRACHEIHAGVNTKRIKDFVPFGEWEYPVNFRANENGGYCAPGCHIERRYDRREEIIQE